MRFLTILSVGVLAAPLAAQNALSETFDYSSTSTFPPSGWSNVNNNGGTYPGWEEPTLATTSLNVSTLVVDAAGHDDFGGSSTCDNSLRAPSMDLSSFATPNAIFDAEVYYYIYMAHAIGSFGNGTSDVELSTDGGVTWASEWSETAQSDGYYPGISIDLATYAGNAAVEMQFHYFGDYAHCWSIDNVVVDNGGNPTGPGLSVSGTCPGVQNANASGMTAGGPVAFYYALAAGSTTIPSGGCAGLTLPVAAPTQLGGFVIADAAGNASLSGSSQPSHCGLVILGAVDVATCTGSNTVTL